MSVEIDGYRDLKLIAAGVHRARQAGTDRPVVLKILASVQAAARLDHPHIAEVLETRELPDGRTCVVMPYYDQGCPHGPLRPTDVIAIGVAVADALAFAHARGVVHGNLSPHKVFAIGDTYVLAGLGLGGSATVADDLRALASTLSTLLGPENPSGPLKAILSDGAFPDAAGFRDALSGLRAPVAAAPGVWLIPAPRLTTQAAPPLVSPADTPPLVSAAIPPVPPPVPVPVPDIPAPASQVAATGWPRLALLAFLSLLLGGALTLGLAWVRSLNAAAPTVPGGARPVPSLVADPGRPNDPAIAPEITGLADLGGSLDISWTDRSGGKASFVVVEVTAGAAVPLVQVDAGRTEVVVRRTDPARPSCVAVVAVTETAQAISAPRCRDTR